MMLILGINVIALYGRCCSFSAGSFGGGRLFGHSRGMYSNSLPPRIYRCTHCEKKFSELPINVLNTYCSLSCFWIMLCTTSKHSCLNIGFNALLFFVILCAMAYIWSSIKACKKCHKKAFAYYLLEFMALGVAITIPIFLGCHGIMCKNIQYFSLGCSIIILWIQQYTKQTC